VRGTEDLCWCVPLTRQCLDLEHENESKRSQVAKECKVINGEMRHYGVEEAAPQEESEDQPERRSLNQRLGPQTSATEYADKEHDSEVGRVGKELVSVNGRMHHHTRDGQTKEDDDEAIPQERDPSRCLGLCESKIVISQYLGPLLDIECSFVRYASLLESQVAPIPRQSTTSGVPQVVRDHVRSSGTGEGSWTHSVFPLAFFNTGANRIIA
jgi:hypothetical protein